MATALDVLDEWMTEGVFVAGDRLIDPTDSYLQHRADCVEEIARAIHQIAKATAGRIYPYLGVDELPAFRSDSLVSHLFPSMVGAMLNTPRKMVRLKVPSPVLSSLRFGDTFEPRGRYGLNAIGLDRQVGRDGQSRAQLCLHLSSRAFVPYVDIGRPMSGQGVSYLWATITTEGVLRFERVTCEIDTAWLLEASFNQRSKGDAMKITRYELATEKERHTEGVSGLTSDLSSLAVYLREIAVAQARL